MAQNYTRQSAFSDGDTITATLFNDEYNQLVNTFTYSSSDASATGHRHDGSTGEGGNIYRIGDLDFLNKIEADSSNNRWGFWVEVSSIAVEQLRIQDGAIVPVTDNDIDLGTSSLEFKNLYLDGTAKVDVLVVDETATITGAATLSSDLTVAGNTTLNGNTTIGNAATDTVTITADVSSNIIPSADSTYTLGDSSNYWYAGYIDALTTTGNVSIGGNLTVTGNATISGNLTFGDADTDTVSFSADVSSHILPDVDDTYDLGSSTKEWRNLYVDGTANIDSLVADTADINGGTIDGAIIATSDVTVGAGKTLDVSAGTLTLADNQISGDKVEGGTIAATTITSLASTTVDTTNIEVTNLKAKDGTAAGSIADATGVVTLASSVLTTTDINGGTIDGATIGGASAAAGTFTNLTASGTVSFSGAMVSDGGTVTTVNIDGGSIDGTIIGAASTAAGSFTTGQFDTSLNVDGTITADGLTVSTATDALITIADATLPSIQKLELKHNAGTSTFTSGNNGVYGSVDFKAYDGTSTINRLGIATNGDISFYEDTGTTAQLVWDASADALTFGDSVKATFGAGSDLQIYHDGSHSYVSDQGTGNLRIYANDLVLANNDGSETFLYGVNGGAVSISYANNAKLATTSTGIDVTGTVTADGLIIDTPASGAAATISMRDNTADSFVVKQGTNEYINVDTTNTVEVITLGNTTTTPDVIIPGGNVGIGSTPVAKLDVNGNVFVRGDNAGLVIDSPSSQLMRITTNSSLDQLSFGSGNLAEAMRIDSSGNLLVGTTSSTYKVDVTVSGNNGIRLQDGTNQIYLGWTGGNAATGTLTNVPYTFVTNGTEAARIDSSGNLLVGKTATNYNNDGFQAFSGGFLHATGTQAVANSGTIATLNRKSTDGSIVDFRKDGTAVGSIGSVAGQDIVIGSGSAGLRFLSTGPAIQPRNADGTVNNDAIDLGLSTNRFKDLYLSGTANAAGLSVDGGTIKLDGNYPVGTNNVALGNNAGAALTSGINNTFLGSLAGDATTTASKNVAIGYAAFTTNTSGYDNTAVGHEALRSNTTGALGVAIGKDALYANTTGNYNIGIGVDALTANTTASYNTAVGYQASRDSTTGQQNVFMGGFAGADNTTGTLNTGVGYSTLGANGTDQTGSYNTALGGFALQNNTTASNNTAVGYQAGYSNTTGNQNVAVGAGALQDSTTGSNSVAIGQLANENNTTGSSNVSVGRAALNENTSGNNSVAIGRSALLSNTTASNNTAVGFESLYTNTTGTNNVSVGFRALYSNTTADQNAAFGTLSLFTNSTGNYNTALGQAALYSNTTVDNNTAVGYQAAYNNTTGTRNTALGSVALTTNTTGSYNTALGGYSLYYSTTASNNTATGYLALHKNTTGASNAALGMSALEENTTASNNTAVGYQSLQNNTTASDNTAVGYRAGYSNTTGTLDALGDNALRSNTTGGINSAFGRNSQYNTTTGTRNASFGSGASGVYAALQENSTGSYNTAIGISALGQSTTASYNTAVGYEAGYTGTTAQQQTFVGYQAGRLSTGSYNTAVGSEALETNAAGTANVAVGKQALTLNTSGNYNTGLGTDALFSNTTASNNTAVGYVSLYANTTGTGNTAIGQGALESSTTASYNTAIGRTAGGSNTTGANNFFGGVNAGANNTTGSFNTVVGGIDAGFSAPLEDNTTGGYNTALGSAALKSNTTASNNTAVGYQAGYNNTTGVSNTAFGYQAAYSNSTGTFNTYLGWRAGYTATGSNNTFLGFASGYSVTTGGGNTFVGSQGSTGGYGAGYYMTTGSNNTIIGAFTGNQGGLDIRTSSNYIVLSDGDGNPRHHITNGGFSKLWGDTTPQSTSASYHELASNTANLAVYVTNKNASGDGIIVNVNSSNNTNYYLRGYSNSAAATRIYIHTSGNIYNANGTYGTISDLKLKQDVVDAASQWDDIKSLRVRKFRFKEEPEAPLQLGLIAQEAEEVSPGLVEELVDRDAENNDLGTTTKAVKYSILYMKAVKALQEAMERIETLEAKVAALEAN